jgi:hypothetical protein
MTTYRTTRYRNNPENHNTSLNRRENLKPLTTLLSQSDWWCDRLSDKSISEIEKVKLLLYVMKAECWGGAYRGADKSLARPERKQATATEDFDFRISYL